MFVMRPVARNTNVSGEAALRVVVIGELRVECSTDVFVTVGARIVGRV
jgi:hypothetical protein